MGKRKVSHKKQDLTRDIIALCNNFETWSPRYKKDVIYDIENDLHSYFVEIDDQDVDVVIMEGTSGKYLRTDPDKTAENYLLKLPDCT
ncbi:MAG: DUF3892 domain-containing protein [Candidatus Cloacimonetes bacterium]|nr:DUF3892 domain-containing protein [Candidatus Cloacimonadota bacterium]